MVKTFVNPVLAGSLDAGSESHPAGAAAIQEVYRDGELAGWTVMLKTQSNGASGDGWFWYEVLSATDAARKLADGGGVGYCADCHRAGRDFVRSGWPLK